MYGFMVWFDQRKRKLAMSGLEKLELGSIGWHWPGRPFPAVGDRPGWYKFTDGCPAEACADSLSNEEDVLIYIALEKAEVESCRLGLKTGVRSQRWINSLYLVPSVN